MTKNMTVTEMWQLRELLQKWEAEYKDKSEYWKQRILQSPDDDTLDRGFHWIAICEEEAKKVRYICREVEFQIEDETGEVLVK